MFVAMLEATYVRLALHNLFTSSFAMFFDLYHHRHNKIRRHLLNGFIGEDRTQNTNRLLTDRIVLAIKSTWWQQQVWNDGCPCHGEYGIISVTIRIGVES